MPGQDGVVLMSREYVPEAGRAGARIVRSADGLEVDRIDVRTLRTAACVEAANRSAAGYILQTDAATSGSWSSRAIAARPTS